MFSYCSINVVKHLLRGFKQMKKLLAARTHSTDMDVALLLLRLVCGLAFVLHGWGKIQNPFHWMGAEAPVPAFLQGLAALAEFGGGIAWIVGLLTRAASLGIMCTMIVATLMHRFVLGDPFVSQSAGGGSYELALVYLTIATMLLISGPGRFSIDRKIFGA